MRRKKEPEHRPITEHPKWHKGQVNGGASMEYLYTFDAVDRMIKQRAEIVKESGKKILDTLESEKKELLEKNKDLEDRIAELAPKKTYIVTDVYDVEYEILAHYIEDNHFYTNDRELVAVVANIKSILIGE